MHAVRKVLEFEEDCILLDKKRLETNTESNKGKVKETC